MSINTSTLAVISYTSTEIYQDQFGYLRPIGPEIDDVLLIDRTLMVTFLVIDLTTSAVYAQASAISDAPTQQTLLNSALESGRFPSHDINAPVMVFERNDAELQVWLEESKIGPSPVTHYDNAMRVGMEFSNRITDILKYFRRQLDRHLTFYGLQIGIDSISQDFSRYLKSRHYNDLLEITNTHEFSGESARTH